MSADWNKIKTEYITTDTSYRKLGEKYGIHYKVIADRGRDEKWKELRSQHRDKTLTKTLTAVTEDHVERAKKLHGATDKLLNRVVYLIDNGDPLRMGASAMKNLSEALINIGQLLNVKSDADMREQEARIANLEKQAQKDDKNGTIQVVIEGELMDYGK